MKGWEKSTVATMRSREPHENKTDKPNMHCGRPTCIICLWRKKSVSHPCSCALNVHSLPPGRATYHPRHYTCPVPQCGLRPHPRMGRIRLSRMFMVRRTSRGLGLEKPLHCCGVCRGDWRCISRGSRSQYLPRFRISLLSLHSPY